MLLHFLGFFIILQVLYISASISCHKDIKLNWSATISDSPVVSAPLLVKSSNALHSDRLVVATHDGSVTVISTASGLEDAQWPVHFPEKAFFAGPLMYDIDEDGTKDILLTASDGEIMFVSWNGKFMDSQTIVLPRLLVKRNWNIIPMEVIKDSSKEPDLAPSSNTLFISLPSDRDRFKTNLANKYIIMDTHILSTPVVGDFNGDGVNAELIVAVNFYFDDEIKDSQRLKDLALEESDIDSYLASGLIVVDLKSKEVILNTTLELTMKSSDFPAYLLSSPMVTDLDGSYGEPEVIIASMSGMIHVLNKAGKYPWTFVLLDSIYGQLAVGDMNNDGELDIIAVDRSANAVCYSKQGIVWESSVSGTITAGAQLEDINQDGNMEVIIATNDGYIWVLDGQSGKVLPNWPLKLGDEIHSEVLFTKNSDQSVDITVMCDGNLNIIGGTSRCVEVIPTEEISYVQVISDWYHMAFIVSTNDGAVQSYKQNIMNGNFTRNKKTGISFTEPMRGLNVVTSSSFNIEFEIFDKHGERDRWKFYTVIISFSTKKGIDHHVKHYNKPGVYSITFTAPPYPKKSYVSLELCNQFKYCTEDIMYVMFHPKATEHLVIYALLPFLVMVFLLLVFHGFPEGDLLPTWEGSESEKH